jgi:phosphate transport system protein
MSRQSSDELKRLASLMERQGERVLHQVTTACRALSGLPHDLADPSGLEHDIDREEVVLEEECLRIMALHHPIGSELRALVTVLRANGDLERIADHAFSILEVSSRLGDVPDTSPLALLSVRVLVVLGRVLAALRDRDPRVSQSVLDEGPALRSLHEAAAKSARTVAGSGVAADIDRAFLQARVALDLVRMGDLACNLAEDVLYWEEGRIVRHAGTPVGAPSRPVD